MNDFEYDCLQKKRIAQSAKKKVHPKKGCSLPSDHLTTAQKKKLNGDVSTVNLNKPITYRYFKTLSNDLQILYYNHLVKEFGATMSNIAGMMGVGRSVLSKHIKAKDLSIIASTKGSRLKKPYEWKIFCDGNYGNKIAEPKPTSPALWGSSQNDCNALSCEKLVSYHLQFNNVSNWLDIFQMLSAMPLPNNATIYVNVGGCDD